MQIETFAEIFKVKVRRDSCGERIIPGRPHNSPRQEDRSHVFDYGDGRFGVCLLFNTVGRFNHAKKQLLAVGMTPGQSGHTEGTLSFSPENKQQAKAALREVGAREKRKLSPERAAQLTARLTTARNRAENPTRRGVYSLGAADRP